VLTEFQGLRVAALLAAITIPLFFLIPLVASHYGPRVAARFLERGIGYSPDKFHRWATRNRRLAMGYAFPVLFPLDLVFLLCLGGFLATTSSTLLEHGGQPGLAKASLFLPMAYIVTDFLEDALLAWILLAPRWIKVLVTPAKVLTGIKMLTCFLAMVQTAVISAWALA
jgi:hypothetical protein